MDIILKNSRNGSLTCTKDSFSLHSTFDPEKEAERFVSLIESSYIPSFIVITGPCLGYTAQYLKKRFPDSKTIAIQYSTDFEQYSKNWDFSFSITKQSDTDFINDRLFSVIGEEKLFSTLFISWKPSEKAWPDLAATLWKSFKDLLSKAESVISTRSFFNRRWFLNTIRFYNAVKTISIPEKTDKPIVVTASGPSLAHALPFLKKHRESFVLIAASYSVLPLLENEIIPDFCITTDGGWWAKKHLEPLIRLCNKLGITVPLIVPPESAVPTELLSNTPIVPLSYSDFPDKLFFDATGIPFIAGERNGTVSGTAAVLALNMTTSSVFFCGLDLAPSLNCFQHTQPNALEPINNKQDIRLKPTETRITSSAFSGSGSLGIYRNWFSSRNESFYKRVFRLVSEKDSLEPISHLKDICIDSEIPECFIKNNSKHSLSYKTSEVDTTRTKKQMNNFLEKIKAEIDTNAENPYNIDWYKIAALKEVVLSERAGKKTVSDEIKEKTTQLIETAITLLNRMSK
ncbi:MAG: DUF115 domain-containing protein [Spirochaetaceae bacterium]|nr:DUF115 domain-containing protein [Spirochaetaceae bacterium]